MDETLDQLLTRIRACRICADKLGHQPRPVVRARETARIAIVGQAPGTRVHASGAPFTDPSGNRLRDWMGVSSEEFYDESRIAIAPMGFCFPGLDAKGGDKPPRKECAPEWQAQLFGKLPHIRTTLLVGAHAQRFHLGARAARNMTETVRNWREYWPEFVPTPHPSWRNNAWLKRNPWFADEVLPALRLRVRELLG
ncbi:uracil-DNA glycosylase family protein [Euryhalocaulis caribicus]|uniref:uracil-DNA glycosylase family protein n=1 Tax=Euryhalocaulis caribicus TaxID=1161401 RepID=UPI00039FAA65|nr:uracil-DNA glycosylase family protein [Euryhalocaulis caribicus]